MISVICLAALTAACFVILKTAHGGNGSGGGEKDEWDIFEPIEGRGDAADFPAGDHDSQPGGGEAGDEVSAAPSNDGQAPNGPAAAPNEVEYHADQAQDSGNVDVSSKDGAVSSGSSTAHGDREVPADQAAPSNDGQAPSDRDRAGFYITDITDDVFIRMDGKSFKKNCTLPREDLRYLHVLHKDLDGKDHEGELVVNYHIAEDVLDIFKKLYEAGYPIEKVRLVDEYDADDEASMEDNNSSSFNFRYISGTSVVSKHGRGLAVDINPLYNPYAKTRDGKLVVEPVNAGPYLDRNADFPYKINKNDLCYRLFKEKGFEWGGDWEDRKDYQHFEIPDRKISEWYPH